MDHRGKGFTGLVMTGCNAPELVRIAEEIVNRVAPVIHQEIAAHLILGSGLWRNDCQSATLIEVPAQGITVESFVGEEVN